MTTIVVVGSYGTGLTVTLDRAPAAGETVVGHDFVAAAGGKGSNQAIGAARLGARAILCTVVGSDQFGSQARALWSAEGVDASLVATREGSTMVGVILVESHGENRIAIVPGVLADFGPDDLTGLDAALAGADVLLVGLEIPTATAFAALRIARARKVITVLNPAPSPDGPLAPELLALVDHLTPNRSEAARLAGMPLDADPLELVTAPCLAGVETVALTLGGDGVVLRHGGDVCWLDAVPARAVDTTGAGDAFNAAYAVRLGAGDPPREAARFAVRAAAVSVTRPLVVPSLPFLADLAAQ